MATDTVREQRPSEPPLRRNRDVLLLVTANALSLTGNAALPIGLSFAVLDMTGRAQDVALVLMAETVPMVLLILLGGVWADRVDRCRLMIAADLVRAAAALLSGVLLLSGSSSVPSLAALMVVYGAASAFFQPAVAGLLPSLTDGSQQLQRANGLMMAVSGTTWIVGPALASLLIALQGPGAVLVFDGLTFLASGAAVAAIRRRRAARPGVRVDARAAEGDSGTSMWRDLITGWQEFTARSWVWLTIASVGVMFALVIAPLNSLGPIVAKTAWDGSASWAVIVASLSAGRVLGGVTAMFWLPRKALFWACAAVALQATATAALAGSASLALVVATNVAGGFGVGYFLTAWGVMLQQWIPADRLSRVNSYDWFGSLLAMPLGYLLVALVVDRLGVSTVLWGATAAVFVAIVPLLLNREVRRLPRSPEVEGSAR